MNGTLKLNGTTLAYADVGSTSNPTKKYVDWSTTRKYSVSNPKSEPFDLAPGASLTLFSGARSMSTDGTTQLTLTLSTLASTRYRFAFSSGTDPVLRVARALSLAGRSVVVTANGNNTITMTTQAGDWSALQVGDTVFVPDVTTGDAATPFNPLNAGIWTVLAVAANGSNVQLARPSGFIGYAETAAVASNAQVLAYGADGVQVGDKVRISAGFTAPVLGTYEVVAVTSKWFEVTATKPLPTGVSATPGDAGLQFYTNAKRYIRIEGDQQFVATLNGAALPAVEAWEAGDEDNTGWIEMCGPVWSAVVQNTSSSTLNLLLISAE
jgi:hypothetical protein